MKQKIEEALQLSGAVQGYNTALGSTRQIRLATDARYAEPAFRTPLTDEELYELADAIREIRNKTPWNHQLWFYRFHSYWIHKPQTNHK